MKICLMMTFLKKNIKRMSMVVMGVILMRKGMNVSFIGMDVSIMKKKLRRKLTMTIMGTNRVSSHLSLVGRKDMWMLPIRPEKS